MLVDIEFNSRKNNRLKRLFRNIGFEQQEASIMDINLNIDELNFYVNGLRMDIDVIKNTIQYKYNNGLAEGSVNKIN